MQVLPASAGGGRQLGTVSYKSRHKVCGSQKVHSGFSVTCYGQTRTNFLDFPILKCALREGGESYWISGGGRGGLSWEDSMQQVHLDLTVRGHLDLRSANRVSKSTEGGDHQGATKKTYVVYFG